MGLLKNSLLEIFEVLWIRNADRLSRIILPAERAKRVDWGGGSVATRTPRKSNR